MFGRKKKNHLHHHIDSLIGTNTHITGDISFTGGLRIDGHIVGNVIAVDERQSTLVLSNEGSIKGNIKAANIVLNGTVIGSIQAGEYLDLQECAKVYGDVMYGTLEIQLGASVEGKMIHQGTETEHTQSLEKMLTLKPSETDQSNTVTKKEGATGNTE